jgi:Protein of unknown function (DUF2867)
MRIPNAEHASRPWRIHEITPDFRLEDVWRLPGAGGPGDFLRLVQGFASADPAHGPSGAVRTLWAIRWKVGQVLGWDGPDTGLGSRVSTLRDRLPADLRDGPSGPEFDALPFNSLYLTHDEWAAEVANRTVHGVLHIGRIPDGTCSFRAQMAVLVKPNGLLGNAYMAAIRPFRHLIVYPAMMREIERASRASVRDGPGDRAGVASGRSDGGTPLASHSYRPGDEREPRHHDSDRPRRCASFALASRRTLRGR